MARTYMKPTAYGGTTITGTSRSLEIATVVTYELVSRPYEIGVLLLCHTDELLSRP